MKTVRIAFDVDGCLRCNGGKRDHGGITPCGDTCEEPNLMITRLFNLLAVMKNTEMYVWSGGGADYARRFADKYRLRVAHSRCLSKLGEHPVMDIAVDDIQDTDLGIVNIIVRKK
jgi:hypothetical protein